jgi:hypothetical protein
MIEPSSIVPIASKRVPAATGSRLKWMTGLGHSRLSQPVLPAI